MNYGLPRSHGLQPRVMRFKLPPNLPRALQDRGYGGSPPSEAVQVYTDVARTAQNRF